MSVEHRNPLLQQYQATAKVQTASTRLTGNDAGKAFTNTGASGAITLTLPKATTNRTFTFLGNAASNLAVQPLSTDNIRGSSAGVATNLASGTLLALQCVTPGTWEITNGSGGGGGGGGSNPYNITPDTHSATASFVYNDEFEYGTAIDTAGARFASAEPWVWTNQAGSTTAVAQGAITIVTTGAGLQYVAETAPAPPWTIVLKQRVVSAAGGLTGILVYNSGNTNSILFGPWFAPPGGNAGGVRFTGASAISSWTFSLPIIPTSQFVYLKIYNDGTNLQFSYSYTG